MNDEVTKNEENVTDEIDVKGLIQKIIHTTLKNKVKGHIFVKVEEKENEKDDDTMFVNITNNGVSYTDRITLVGDTYRMVSENESYATTLGLMILDNYKKFIEMKFFIKEKPVKNFKKFKEDR